MVPSIGNWFSCYPDYLFHCHPVRFNYLYSYILSCTETADKTAGCTTNSNARSGSHHSIIWEGERSASCSLRPMLLQTKTRHSVNYAKDWLDHSFLFPGLVWSEKRVSLWMWPLGGSSNHFPVYWAIFGMVTNEQPGDPSASLLLTSVRRQSFAIVDLIQSLCGRSLVGGAALQHYVSVKPTLDSNFSIHHDYHPHPHDYHHHYLSPGVAKRKQL